MSMRAVGDDLPGEAEFVLQPAALNLFAALGELAPIVVHLLLALAVDLERDRLGELEVGTAVQADESLPFEIEHHDHDRAGLSTMLLVSLVPVGLIVSMRESLKMEQ